MAVCSIPRSGDVVSSTLPKQQSDAQPHLFSPSMHLEPSNKHKMPCAACQNLQSLVLDCIPLGRAGACIVLDSAVHGRCLQVLSLHACSIGPQCCKSLQCLLERGTSLLDLNLGFNMCGDYHLWGLWCLCDPKTLRLFFLITLRQYR